MIRVACLALAAAALSGCAVSSAGTSGGALGSGALDFVSFGASEPPAAPGSQDNDRFGLLLNDERGRVSVQPVTFDQALTDAAQAHASDMERNDYFSHTGLNGSTVGDRVAAAGYDYDWAAENILQGTTDEATAVRAWMNSPPHRDAMLDPRAEEFGLGLEGDIYVLILADPAGP